MKCAIGKGLSECLDSGRRSPADAFFLVLWLSATATLAINGDRFDALQGVVVGAILRAALADTKAHGIPAGAPASAQCDHWRVSRHIDSRAYWGRGAGGTSLRCSGAWNALHWGITARLVPFVRVLDDQSLDNTVRYVLVPMSVLLLLGWRARNFGCGTSRKGTGGAVILWSALPLVGYSIAAAIIGHGKPIELAHRFFIDVFRNGYAEEILFRGMLLGVVAPRLGLATGNVFQALTFGLWHLGPDLREAHGIVWMAIADGVATQAIAGYAYGSSPFARETYWQPVRRTQFMTAEQFWSKVR